MNSDATVLSVPAGITYDFIFEHGIYSCPNAEAYDYNECDLMTFRTHDGHMETVFRVEKVVTLDPLDVEATYGINENLLDRIKGYISAVQHTPVLDRRGEYRFYVLDIENTTNLPHRPKGRTRLVGPAYFTFSQLTRGEREV